MSKGIVTCYLWHRKGTPSVNAEKIEEFKSGDEIEIIDVVLGETENDYYEGTPTWYKLKGGNYVWSGGVSLDLDNEIFQKKIEYDTRVVKIKEQKKLASSGQKNKASKKSIFKGYKGTGIGISIAILDSGVEKSNAFLDSRIKHYDSFLPSRDFSNIHVHGTQVAGIITSAIKEYQRNVSDIYCFRVLRSNGYTDGNAVIKALRDIRLKKSLYEKVDLINMSFDIDEDYHDDFQKEVDQLLNTHGIICIASCGLRINSRNEIRLNKIYNIKNIVRVCAVATKHYSQLQSKGIPNDVHVTFIDSKIPTCSIGVEDTSSIIQNDSAFTAYTIAIVARHLQISNLSKDSNRYKSITTYLNSITTGISLITKPKDLQPLK